MEEAYYLAKEANYAANNAYDSETTAFDFGEDGCMTRHRDMLICSLTGHRGGFVGHRGDEVDAPD